MIHIDHLRIHLPAGFERRAARIARLVADDLAAGPVSRDAEIGSLRVDGIVASRRTSDRRLAAQIAEAIRSRTPGVGG